MRKHIGIIRFLLYCRECVNFLREVTELDMFLWFELRMNDEENTLHRKKEK